MDAPAKMKVMDCGAEPGAKQVLRPLRFKCDDTRLQSHAFMADIPIYTHTHMRIQSKYT